MANNTSKNILIPILLIFLAVVIGALTLLFIPKYPVISDSLDYDNAALTLLQEKKFLPSGGVLYPPGYPFFLAIIYAIFGHNYNAVYIIQFLLLGGIGVVVYFLGKNRLKFSDGQAVIVSIVTILWPYFILYPMLLMSEILFIFLFLLFVYYFLDSRAISGLFLGLATLTRPVILLLPFWLIFFAFLFAKKISFKKPLVIFLIIISLWITFTYINSGRIIPVASNLPVVLEKAYKTLGYEEEFQNSAPAEINLQTIVVSKLKNIYLFWNPGAGGYQAEAVTEKYALVRYLFLLYKIVFFIILGLAFISLKFWKTKEIFFLWTIIFYFWSLHTILFPFPRYTLPIMPLVIILAIFTIKRAYEH